MTLLHAKGIVKTFPGVRALDRVSFELRAGEVHALVGENGAGKSTLIRILTGAHRPDEGTIELEGKPVALASPLDAQRRGIASVHQEIDLIPDLSLAENLWLGREPRRFGLIRRRAAFDRARDAMQRVGLEIDLAQPARRCSAAIRQLTAIARAIDENARVLILDEPTSSLDAAETQRLFRLIRSLVAEGRGVVFITHFFDQVFELSSRVTVLRNGRHIATHETGEVSRVTLIADMLGRETGALASLEHREPGASTAESTATLSACGLRRGVRIGPIDLTLHRGEVTGLAGLLGSGRTETARMLAGADRPDAGEITRDQHRGRWRSPRHAIDHGVAFTPEDRRGDAIFPSLPLADNITISAQVRLGLFRRLPGRERRQLAADAVARFGIVAPDDRVPIGMLSGGNQQKAILARCLAARPAVLLLDEPTRGVDIGARADIERTIAASCEEGLSVLIISSELDEIERLASRVLVLRDGRVVGEVSGADISADLIMRAIAGDAS
ncbi:MAG: sugar ABC transporter ATP-binding protein [Phycisphaerales bacterium JB037]